MGLLMRKYPTWRCRSYERVPDWSILTCVREQMREGVTSFRVGPSLDLDAG